MTELAYERRIPDDEPTAVARLTAALQDRGFGVLATIRVHEILREKLGVAAPPATILEVCSPRHAHAAFAAHPDAALLLPCKIVVFGGPDGSRIALLRPGTLLARLLPDPALERVGAEVEGELRQALDAVAGAPA